MDAIPPPGTIRRRAAVVLVLLIASLFAYVSVHGLLDWITKGGRFPVRLVLSAATAVFLGGLLLREARRQLEREP